MAQIFHRSTNVLSRITIYAAVFIVAGIGWILMAIDRSPYTTGEGVVLRQPVPFSHALHAGQLGMDCRYCNTTVEGAAFAAIPPSATCMNVIEQRSYSRKPLTVRETFAQAAVPDQGATCRTCTLTISAHDAR
jgi:hypothetical protein